jgi:VWFA-related protein
MNARTVLLSLLVLAAVTTGANNGTPLALLVEVEALGVGAEGTVMGIVLRVAPEDRDRLSERIRVVLTLLNGTDIVNRHSATVSLSDDGSTTLYREWPVGSWELRAGMAAMDGEASGVWIGDIEVSETELPFVAPEGATADAVALELTPPDRGGVSFMPPPEIGGIGAVQLEIEAPEETRSVEFFREGKSLGRRNRPPWTVSVPLGDIVRRTTIRAVALDSRGRFIGEDAVVLNNPTGQIGVEILLAPESTITDGNRRITVAITGTKDLQQVTLSVDDREIAKWVECPCSIEVPVAQLEQATILAADAVDVKGNRGDSVITLVGGVGFVGSVRVELVELPIVVLDNQGVPVTDLELGDFRVYEDDSEVAIEGFGTTAELPLSLAIAVDTSGSMVDAFSDVRSAVRGFTNSLLEQDDEVVLIRFSWDAEVEVAWTDDVQKIEGRLDDVMPDGGTSLNDAVVRSLEQFRGRRGRQAVVLLTDGEDTTSRTDWRIAERFSHTMRVPIFPIGLGLGRLDLGARGILKKLARQTGGEFFLPKGVQELPAVYDRIAELLRSQYLLWYPSPSDKPDTEFRSIRVEVADQDLQVKTISGYYPGK